MNETVIVDHIGRRSKHDRTERRWSFVKRWKQGLGWSRSSDDDVRRFVEEVGDAMTREEVHAALVRRAEEWTGADRIELSVVGSPRRICQRSGEAGKESPGHEFRLPLVYRGQRLGTLTISGVPSDRLDRPCADRLATFCDIAAMADRLLGRERELRSAISGRGESLDARRGMILAYIRQLLLMARRRREPLTVMAIGLDRLVGLRKVLGPLHVAEAMTLVGRIVRDSLRESDLVVHYDEGVLLAVLPNASAVDAPWIAETVIRSCDEAQDDEVEPLKPRPTVSIGVATYPESANEPDLLFDEARLALRQAQSQGERQVMIAAEEYRASTIGCSADTVMGTSKVG